AEEDLFGQNLSVLLPPAEVARDPDYLAATCIDALPRAVGAPGHALTARRADGSEFPMEGSVGCFEVDSERFYTAVLRDVTARVAADAALRTGERRYRTLVEAGAQILWRTDPQGATVE